MITESKVLDISLGEYKRSKITPQVELVEFIKTGFKFICKTTNVKEGLDELTILKKLNQSNCNCIPKLIDYKMTHQSLKIYTNNIDGITFSQLIKSKMKKNASLQNLELILYNAIKALNAIHTEGVLHLDLKPENLIIDRHYNVFIIDFSTSIFTENRQQLNHFVGSWGYISPEMMFLTDKVDESSDYFSLGKILLELIGKQYNLVSYEVFEKILAMTHIQQEKRKEIMKDFIKTLA
ncbi:protein kinase [Fusibacter bizertensis]|uniref:Protein kinase n=1 Tax=Fusibacter bizertensis TaxID=1488331 RepID=A0ABT6NB88_9FIRM|nr:protein kinase [Fusibacter bizertensis]MDH8677664.1 protein kinase [Fusibacter bizertensis]